MLQTEDLPRMTSLSPGNNVIDLKSTVFTTSRVSTKYMNIYEYIYIFCIYILCVLIYILYIIYTHFIYTFYILMYVYGSFHV